MLGLRDHRSQLTADGRVVLKILWMWECTSFLECKWERICCDNTGWYYVIFPGSSSSKFLTRRLQDHEKPYQSALNNICSLSSSYIFSSLFITRKEELDFCFRIPSSKFEPTKLSVTPLIFMSSLSLQLGLWRDWYVGGMVASFAITYA